MSTVPKEIKLVVSSAFAVARGATPLMVDYGGTLVSIKGLEAQGVVTLSTMDRMILVDLTRKLQAIAIALEARS